MVTGPVVATSGPEPEAETGDETGSEDKDGNGTCKLVSNVGKCVHGAQVHELTAPVLSGCRFPLPSTVYPLGITDAVAVPSHGHPVLVAYTEAESCGSKARGALLSFGTVEVIAGGFSADAGLPLPSGLTLPPSDWIDCQVPSVPE